MADPVAAIAFGLAFALVVVVFIGVCLEDDDGPTGGCA